MKNLNLSSDKDSLLIQRHFDYDLNDDESDEFYERLNTEPGFATKVDRFRKIHEATLKRLHKEVVDPAKLLAEEAKETTGARIIPLFKKMAIAATIALGLGVGFDWLRPPTVQAIRPAVASLENLYGVKLDKIERSLKTTPNQTKVDLTRKDSLLIAFQQKDFSKCIELTNEDNLMHEEWLIRGIAFIELKELEKAKTIFLREKNTTGGQIDMEVWGLTHIYIKQGEPDSAIIMLNYLIDDVEGGVNTRITKKARAIRTAISK